MTTKAGLEEQNLEEVKKVSEENFEQAYNLGYKHGFEEAEFYYKHRLLTEKAKELKLK